MKNGPFGILAFIVTIVMVMFVIAWWADLRREQKTFKPWSVYYSGQTASPGQYYRFTDNRGRLHSDSFTDRSAAEAALEAEILRFQNEYAIRVWREVP